MGPILGGPALVRYLTNKANVVCHGNSITRGQSGATVPMGAWPYQVQRMSPVNNQVECINKGVDGQTWAGMRSTGSQVDALYVENIPNVLIISEGHNSQFIEGKTPAQAWDDGQAYCADRLASHPGWLMLHWTLLPAYYQAWSESDSAAGNANLEAYNALLRAGWRGTGAKGLVEMRQSGSPFLFANYQRATFAASNIGGQSIWSPNDQQGGGGTGQNQFVHPSDIGYTAMAQMVSTALRRLVAR